MLYVKCKQLIKVTVRRCWYKHFNSCLFKKKIIGISIERKSLQLLYLVHSCKQSAFLVHPVNIREGQEEIPANVGGDPPPPCSAALYSTEQGSLLICHNATHQHSTRGRQPVAPEGR